MKPLSDDKIIDSWKKNVTPWIEAIRNKEIQSRELITNQAIVEAITQQAPGTVLDIGCGEGWLVRELSKTGIDACGVDVVPGLIESARKAGEGRFKTLSYTQLANNVLNEKFDLAVCNFSLLGKESVSQLFHAMPSLLNANGYLVIQTVHPVTACGDHEYKDGWREGSWAGFNNQFHDPAPWYFRTLQGWQNLFLKQAFELKEVREPVNPQTGNPASVIFIGQLAD